MKKVLALMVVCGVLFSSSAFAERVSGYLRKDGAYVQGYNRSDSNSTVNDNYSHVGNSNPYTGESGSNYNRHDRSSNYYSGY